MNVVEVSELVPRIIRPKALRRALGVTEMTLYRWEAKGLLPSRRRLGPNCVGWTEDEIRSWIESRPHESCSNPEQVESLKITQDEADAD